MKKNLTVLFFATCAVFAQDSIFLPKHEVKNAEGKSITVSVEKITDTHLIGYVGGKKYEITWASLDLVWLEANNKEIFEKYKDAYLEAQMFKTYNPNDDAKRAIVQLLKGMKSSSYKSWNFVRDKSGKTVKIVFDDEGDSVSIGKTYSYISKIVGNYGEDLRKQKARIDANGTYIKDENGTKRMFTKEAEEMDVRLVELSSALKQLYSKIDGLPNAKKQEETIKILSKIKIFADDVLKLRTSVSGLDRSATDRIKAILEEFDSITVPEAPSK